MAKYLKDFERSTALLIEMFCKKHETSLGHIVADQICGIYAFGNSDFFSLDEIYHDLKTDQPKNQIFEWQNACVDAYFQGLELNINYRSWCDGLRFETLKNNLP